MSFISEALVAVLLAGLTSAVSGPDIHEERFASVADAQAKGAVADGRVPAWLPPAATHILAARETGSKRFMLRFSVPKDAPFTLDPACSQVAPRSPAPPPFARGWWPGDVPANSFATHRHAFFRCDDSFFAYAGHLGEGFVWRPK
ncbi:hypothetical protein [Hydrogenophaga sp. RWCD_12]|uniref:hypothetical protein n=1 Tax=Hydrogenophaga sp. RWCD_12 TaxID=3391190 RepID=UPI00398485D7